MTELSGISNNHLALTCYCGHSSNVAVQHFTNKFGKEAKVKDVTQKVRCTKCKTLRMVKDFRIIFVGRSGDALLGTAQRNANDNL